MALNNTKQSHLEKKSIEKRQEELVRSEYNKSEEYSDNHENAVSNPLDEKKYHGKGTQNGGHQHYLPNHDLPSTAFNYSNFNTSEGGGAYDIYGKDGKGGRERLVKINIYNKDNAYGPDSVDTSANIEDGQYVIKG